MPYRWDKIAEAPEQSGAFGFPAERLTLWPHRSLTARGFVWFIGITSALISLPLLSLVGTSVMWGLLPFMLAALGGIWWALSRNRRDRATLCEVLTITPTEITLHRQNADGSAQHWQANPYWVTAHIHPAGGPVPDYLTLRGDGREVELGAFLSRDERLALHLEVSRALSLVR